MPRSSPTIQFPQGKKRTRSPASPASRSSLSATSSHHKKLSHLKAKINHQIKTLQHHFDQQRELRKEKWHETRNLIENQTDDTLKVMNHLSMQCENIDLVWEKIFEWKMGQEAADLWNNVQQSKEKRIQNRIPEVTISLRDIVEKEMKTFAPPTDEASQPSESSNTQPTNHHTAINNSSNRNSLLHEHMKELIKQFRKRNENIYNDAAFAKDLNRFSKLDAKQEENLITEEINRYYETSRIDQKMERRKNRQQFSHNMKSYVDCIMQNKRRIHSQTRDESFEHYVMVSRDELKMIDSQMRESIQHYLPEKRRKEIYHKTSEAQQKAAIDAEMRSILQEVDAVDYKTDIGIHDEEMQELQYEIEQWQEFTLIETSKISERISAEQEKNRQLTEETKSLSDDMDALRKQYKHASSELVFLDELSSLTEDDLAREIEKKSKKLAQVRESYQNLHHSADLLEVTKNSLKQESLSLKESLQKVKEQLAQDKEALEDSENQLKNQRKIAKSLLSKEVWTMLDRWEKRDDQAHQRLKRQLSDCCKESGVALMNSLLSVMYEASVECLRPESAHIDLFSYTAFHSQLANHFRDYKIRERTLLSHLGFLRTVFDTESSKVKKIEKVLKKNQTIWEKKYASWEHVQEEFIAAANSSETLKNVFRSDLITRSQIEKIAQTLWIREELERVIHDSNQSDTNSSQSADSHKLSITADLDWKNASTSNQALKKKLDQISNYCRRLFSKYELFQWYLHREQSTLKSSLTVDLSSPYLLFTKQAVESDEAISDPHFTRMFDCLPINQIVKEREDEIHETQKKLMDECKALRRQALNVNQKDAFLLSESIMLIKQKHNQKYRRDAAS